MESAIEPPPFTSAQSSFPQNPEEFDADPRVSFSKLDNKFILEVDDEHEYEYDDALKRWVPVVRPDPPTIEGILQDHVALFTRLVNSNDIPCWLLGYSWTMRYWSSKAQHMPSTAWMSRNQRSL